MNELRWILVGFGIVLLAAIYLWGRRGGRTVVSEDAVVRVRPEPSMHPSESDAFAPHAAEDAAEPLPAPIDREPMITAIRAAPTLERARLDDAPVEHDRAGPAGLDVRRSRVEPTFADPTLTAELPVTPEDEAPPAPTLSSSEAPQARRIERRKILALRLAAAPQRFEGARLLEALQEENLQHGKYEVFHRLHADGVSIVFSVASMVEPGTFDPQAMPGGQYPGITLFAQLPGPTPGMHALNELVACARKLQQSLGGTLQDDRGVPLTVHRIERLRQEVREFERPPARLTS